MTTDSLTIGDFASQNTKNCGSGNRRIFGCEIPDHQQIGYLSVNILTMTPHDLSILFRRDLMRLREEVNAYESDSGLWKPAPGITNSGGNLALHVCGNLRHFIGHLLGGTSYTRDRDREFAIKNIARSEILTEIDITIIEIIPILETLTADQLTIEFPKEIGGMRQSTGFSLLHLFGHLSYHLGQVNYHRRMTGN
jgi:hypothetical protein